MMKRVRIWAAALAAALVVLAATARGQEATGVSRFQVPCYDRAALRQALQRQGATLGAIGAEDTGGKLELWHRPGGRWLVAFVPRGRDWLCALIEGEGLELAPAAPGVEG